MFLPILFVVAASPAGAHQQGVTKYQAHDYAAAITLLQNASESETPGSPEFRESMLMIGQSYFMLSQASQAIPYLEKVSGLTEADYMLGYAYVQNRQPELSEEAFARLFHLDPKSAAGHLLAAQMLLKKGYEEQAAAQLQSALKLNPALPQTHFLLGEIAIYQGRFQDAVSLFQAELSIDPNLGMAWYRLGDAYVRQQQWTEATANLERAIWLNPDYSGPYFLLGKCYLKQQNYSNAEGILRKGLKLDPNNASGNYLLGQALLAEGKTEEAHAAMEKVKSLHAGPE